MQKWWTDLWLKEGAAVFIQFLFMSIEYPDFDSWIRFADYAIDSALAFDALHNSHSIEVDLCWHVRFI
jgi:aminopeptidase N